MSWQVASFLILGVVLVGGFVWYERSRPPSQVVALVAAMAALAVAGRLALAPIPNVVATTDVVLFTGYAVGGPPGFVTGALAALVSNFWLGQGPWTPWQMAGWGLCGIFGAALAAASGRRLSRVTLAAACGFAGIAYGALLNFSLMVTYGGEVSLDRFAALSVRAIPFDAAHAIGNVTLALLAGPALVRMLVRFRERFEVTWSKAHSSRLTARRAVAPGAVGLLLALAFLVPATAGAGGGSGAGAAWLRAQQGSDGGFPATPGGSSSVAMTGWVALGLEAAGQNPQDASRGGVSAISYLRKNASRIRGAGDLERTILALAGAGLNPRNFAGRDLVARLGSHRGSNGSYGGQVNLTAFGVMAMRAAGSGAGVNASVAWLKRAQNNDGGWGFQSNSGSDADSTGAVLQALRGGKAARDGVAYLRRVQRSGGGWSLAGGGPVNAQSTAWAAQGLVGVGVSPGNVRRGGKSPLDYLARVQAGDGHYRYSASSNQTPVWVTAQALLAVNRKAFPLAAVPRSQAYSGGGGSGTGAGAGSGAAGSTGAGGGAGTEPFSGAAGATGAEGRERLGAPTLPPNAVSESSGKADEKKKWIGGAGAAAALGSGFLLFYRRRYGSLPWK